ncbi:MAG: hypothetical protein QOD92_3371 [Acidimicrobiaceae bacterium]|jgi:hypothetical protein
MTDDAGELENIVVEALDDEEEIDQEDVEVEVERILIRGEARVIAVVSLICIVVGVLFAIGWFFVAWRTQNELSGGGRVSSTGGFSDGDPDLVDRIYALEQIGILLLFSLLLVAGGSGLRLYSTRINAERND